MRFNSAFKGLIKATVCSSGYRQCHTKSWTGEVP